METHRKPQRPIETPKTILQNCRQRIPRSHVFYYKSSAHQNHYVLSFGFAFEKEDEVYQFAIAPPYSYSRIQAYLTALESKFNGRFERSVLTKSLVSLSDVLN